ncbi:uncharacterized protein JCM15063_000504 [Sporobolomyces koalae]|uniref:uncharacterized protein n=1 Tax=Sporobolomyces koalae TaxID=500713 RepID=UPI003174C1A6
MSSHAHEAEHARNLIKKITAYAAARGEDVDFWSTGMDKQVAKWCSDVHTTHPWSSLQDKLKHTLDRMHRGEMIVPAPVCVDPILSAAFCSDMLNFADCKMHNIRAFVHGITAWYIGRGKAFYEPACKWQEKVEAWLKHHAQSELFGHYRAKLFFVAERPNADTFLSVLDLARAPIDNEASRSFATSITPVSLG